MTYTELTRFGISMDKQLLQQFDSLIKKQHYRNRSEAIRDLVRDAIVRQSWEEDEQVVAGSILLFYNHHHPDVPLELTTIQHDLHNEVLATTHFHIDHDHCLEIIVVKGKAVDLRRLSDRLISLKGVKYGKFTVAPVKV